MLHTMLTLCSAFTLCIKNVWRPATATLTWVKHTKHCLGSLNNMITKAHLSAGIGKSHVGEYILPLYCVISLIIFSYKYSFMMILPWLFESVFA